MRGTTALAMVLFLALGAAPALATLSEKPLVDCSMGPIPDVPADGIVNGVRFKPQEVSVQFTENGMSINELAFDRWSLSLQTDGIFNALSVNMLVPHGKKPDGRAFRVLPIDDIGAQPAAAPGTPEVQGWDLELEAADVDTSFTQDTASIRVEWGARKGDVLPGKIHFCVPSAKAEIMGMFSATVR